MALKMAKVLCCFGVKGGIGKSILTLNLAGICNNLEKKVLILDMDLYGGSIAVALNKEAEKTVYNFTDDYNNHRFKDIKDYITKYNSYIDFIACPKDPRKANKISSKYIDILLDKVKFNYDLIIIDTNHILDEINLKILDKSDSILFLISNDIFDLKNMRSLLSIFKDLDIKNYKVLLNQSIMDKEYFSLYDIRNIIKNNIDYVISYKFHIKNIDHYIFDGNIVTMDKKYLNYKDYKIMESIVLANLGDENEKKFN